ncbi:MAG: Flp pilus assembly protein TadG [Kiritimatiellia bacterium]
MKRRYDHRYRRGVQAVEFGLILPVMITLFSGIADYGWLMHRQQLLMNVCREAARAGAVTDEYTDPRTAAEARAEAAAVEYGLSLEEVTVETSLGGVSPNETIEVTLTLAVEPLVGLVPVPLSIDTSLTMRLEEQSDDD